MCDILIIDDDPSFGASIRPLIERAVADINDAVGARCPVIELFCAESIAEAAQMLRSHRMDALLLDLTLQNSTPEQTIQWADENTAILPACVVVTGDGTGRYEIPSLRAGAQAYWAKLDIPLFPRQFIKSVVTAIERRADSEKRYGRK